MIIVFTARKWKSLFLIQWMFTFIKVIKSEDYQLTMNQNGNAASLFKKLNKKKMVNKTIWYFVNREW